MEKLLGNLKIIFEQSRFDERSQKCFTAEAHLKIKIDADLYA